VRGWGDRVDEKAARNIELLAKKWRGPCGRQEGNPPYSIPIHFRYRNNCYSRMKLQFSSTVEYLWHFVWQFEQIVSRDCWAPVFFISTPSSPFENWLQSGQNASKFKTMSFSRLQKLLLLRSNFIFFPWCKWLGRHNPREIQFFCTVEKFFTIGFCYYCLAPKMAMENVGLIYCKLKSQAAKMI
jgi:hypothetical protein